MWKGWRASHWQQLKFQRDISAVGVCHWELWDPNREHQNWERYPHNIWLWNAAGELSDRKRGGGNAGTLLKSQHIKCHVQPSSWAVAEAGQSGLELCEQKSGLGTLGLDLRRQTPWFLVLSHSLMLRRSSFSCRRLLSRWHCLRGKHPSPEGGVSEAH